MIHPTSVLIFQNALFCVSKVLFYDLTEVLISSEGKLITFVDKEKNRFVHTIADVANKQQNDIQRRLKYAKEILSQLITGCKR